MSNNFFHSLRNFITGVLSTAVTIVVPFIARTFIIRFMGEEYLGVNSLFTSIFEVINLANLGFSASIAAFLYKPIVNNDVDHVNSLLRFLTRVNHFIGAVVTIVGIFVYFNLDIFVKSALPVDVSLQLLFIIYLLDLLLSYFFKSYTTILLNALNRADVWCISNTISRIVFGSFQLLIIVFIKRIEFYVLMTAFVSITNRIYSIYYCDKYYPVYKPRGNVSCYEKKKVFRDSLALGLQKIGALLSTSLDNIVIANCIDLVTVARYGNYNYILQAITIFIQTISKSIITSVGYKVASKEKNNAYDEFHMINSFYLSMISIFIICYYSCVQNFVYIWTGNKLFAREIVLLLSLNFFFLQSRSVISLFKDVNGIWWRDRYRPIVGGVINFTLNIILVQYIGLAGVIISTIFSVVFVELPWEAFALFNKESISDFKRFIYLVFKALVVTLFGIALCDLLLRDFSYTILNLFLRGFMSLIIAVLIVVLSNLKNTYFIDLLYFFKRKLKL